MFSALANSFKIPDLKKRLVVTGLLLAIYRIGCYVPTPGIDGQALTEFFNRIAKTQGGTLFGIINMFSGGAMERLTIFALGIMPYISASIILQLLTAVIPALEKLAKEGKAGYEKINQYTRYLTVLTLTTGTIFIMWLGEQIQERGIGNGISLVITAGIISRIPTALQQLFVLLSPFSPSRRQIQPFTLLVMAALLIGVVFEIGRAS